MKRINLFLWQLFSCFLIIGGGISCNENQRLPEFNNNKRLPVADDGPKISIGVDQVFDFDFSEDDESRLKTLVVGQEDATNAQGRKYQKLAMKWNVGDKYRFYATVRYMNLQDENDWRPNFSNDGFTLEILSYDPAKHTGTFKIKGNIDINLSYIDKSGKMPKFIDPDKWYFGGFIGGKLNPEGTAIVDDMGVSKFLTSDGKNNVKGITIQSPNKFVAVRPSAKEFQMNVPIGIPLEKIELSGSNEHVWMNSLTDKPLQLKPIGNILCVQLKNELVHSIGIPADAAIRVNKSRFILGCDLQLDMWHYKDMLSKADDGSYCFHYDAVGGINSKLTNDGYRTPVDMSIDWTQYNPIKRDGDVVLKMDETVNLYVWSIYNTDFNFAPKDGSNGIVDLDFSSLKIKLPEYTPVDENKPNTSFKRVFGDGKVKFFGGADAASNTWWNNYPGLDMDYMRKITKPFSIRQGASIVVPFSIKSELYISEVYFSWKSGKNSFGIIEIYNPNNSSIDLGDYYLLRITSYPSSASNKNKNEMKYWGPAAQRTDRFQNAYIMPLDFATKTNGNIYAFTPAGYADKSMVYYHANDGVVKTDNTKQYKVLSLLYAPQDLATTDYIKSVPPGFCFCVAGHGVYEQAKNGYRTIGSTGLFAEDEFGSAEGRRVKENTAVFRTLIPNQYARIYGVVDGIVEGWNGKLDASANDIQAGSMNRDVNEGWALVKRINGKFYIIDSFGPTFNYNDKTLAPGEFKELMNTYRYYAGGANASLWFERKQNVLYPNGGFMNGTYASGSMSALEQWNVTLSRDSRQNSIGSRARYYKTYGRVGTGSNVPYLFGKDWW